MLGWNLNGQNSVRNAKSKIAPYIEAHHGDHANYWALQKSLSLIMKNHDQTQGFLIIFDGPDNFRNPHARVEFKRSK